jgi:arginyl-tRNA synthetase
MLNLKQALAADISEGIKQAQAAGQLPPGEGRAVEIERPELAEHGQYASPVAFSLAKVFKRKPAEIVEKIVEFMPKKEYVGRLESVQGFLNIRLNPGWLTARLDNVIKEDLCDASVGHGQSVNLEFLSANPTGPLTLGNIRTSFTADTLGNVLACLGVNVTREYYVNDAGGQIRRLGESVLRRIIQAQGEEVEFPVELYQGDYIKEIGQTIAEEMAENEGKEFEKADVDNGKVIELVSEKALQLMLERIKRTVAEVLKIDFDVWTSERLLRESGAIEKILDKLREKKTTYLKDEAEWLKTTDYGDDKDRVLVKKDGEYAYITPDIAYHQEKYARGYDQILTFVGADHQTLPVKLKAAMRALGEDDSKLKVVLAQWIRFKRGGETVKLSKRAGEVFGPEELIAEVGYDAARFFMLQHALTTHMDFDLDLAKERSERNPVYYVQYAYVRLQSILRKAKQEGVIAEVGVTFDLSSSPALTHTFELKLLQEIYRWPEVLAQVMETNSVQLLTVYARELATAIHGFYKQVPILQGDPKWVVSRLQLVLASRTVLGKLLDLLGISKPDVM